MSSCSVHSLELQPNIQAGIIYNNVKSNAIKQKEDSPKDPEFYSYQLEFFIMTFLARNAKSREKTRKVLEARKGYKVIFRK